MLFVARPSLRVDWPWTSPVLWRLLPQSEAGSILVWYVGRRIVCMLLYWCDVVSVCWHLWFWSHSSGPYMMIPEYRLSHALPYTSLWVYGFFGHFRWCKNVIIYMYYQYTFIMMITIRQHHWPRNYVKVPKSQIMMKTIAVIWFNLIQ